jgi:hypothetical protein
MESLYALFNRSKAPKASEEHQRVKQVAGNDLSKKHREASLAASKAGRQESLQIHRSCTFSSIIFFTGIFKILKEYIRHYHFTPSHYDTGSGQEPMKTLVIV